MKVPLLCRWLCGGIFIFLIFVFACDQQNKPDNIENTKSSQLETSRSDRYGGIYRVPLRNNPSTLDPVYVIGMYGVTLVVQIFDRLVEFDSRLMVSPGLAETWRVEEQGHLYRFFLKKNARFHNGRSITAEDVIFSICRLLRTHPPIVVLPHLLKIKGAQAYRDHKSNQVEGLTVINDHELMIRLTEPHTPFLAALGMYQASIVPEEEVVKTDIEFGRNPVGSGPFRFTSWASNQSIWLERFSGYHSGPAFLDKLHFVIYPGEQFENALVDFKNGNLEELPVFGKIREELSRAIGFKIFSRPSLSILFYGLKQAHPLLKNHDFRKALSMAIDRKRLVKEVYHGQFEPANTILPPGMPYYRPGFEKNIFDLDAAKDLIKKVFQNDPKAKPQLEIVSNSTSNFAKAELEFMQESLTRIGVDLKIKFIPNWERFNRYIQSNSAQIYRSAWFADMPDPDSILTPLLSSGGLENHSGYGDQEMDRLLSIARGIAEPVKRAEIYQRIEGLVQESTPIIPLFYLSVNRVYQSNVQGMEISALGAHTMPLNHIWIDRTADP